VSAKLAAAIVKVQAALENVTKDAVNPHFKSHYASLPHILDTVRPVLAAHGLAIVQWPCTSDDGRIGIRTTILHESGEQMEHVFTVRPSKDDPQGAGSAISYCRRYALAAVLNIGQDDDDGEAASVRPPARQPAARKPPQPRAASAPPRDDKEPPWLDERVGFGKHRDQTWRHMASGSVNGERHEWALWLLGEIDAKERSGEKPTPAGLERKERVLWVVQKIEEQIPQTGEAF
jgi:hypothetical protein